MSYNPELRNKISTLNSVVLTSVATGTTWTGAIEDISEYGRAGISIWSKFSESIPNPVNGTITVEVSRDGVNFGGPTRDFANTAISEPHMWNIVEKYFRLKYTHGTVSASTVEIQTQYSVNADVLLGHQLDATLISETEAIVVRSVSVAQTPSDSYTNTKQDGLGFSTTTLLTSGQTYDSGILSIVGYTQVQTDILSVGANGTTIIEFYEDSGGTNLLRTIQSPYVDGAGFKLLSAPAFTPYVRYQWTCTSTGQTQFYYDTKFTTKSISGQILGMTDFIAGGMVANLGRNVNVGQQPDGNFKNDPANGVAIRTIDVLTSGQTYTSPWIDTHGFNSIETFIATDVLSDSVSGITFEITDNLTNNVVRESLYFSFGANELSDGYMNLFVQPKMVGFRIKYTNGGTDQTSFLLQTDLKTNGIITNPIDATLTGEENVILGRNILVGSNDAGNYRNIPINSEGSLKVNNPTTAFGELQTSEFTPDIQLTFPYDVINSDLITTGGTGDFIISNGLLCLAVSGASKTAEVESVGTIHFRAGQGGLIRVGCRFDAGVSGNIRRVGVGEDDNNLSFGYSGTTFGIYHVNSGTTEFTAQATWNQDVMDGTGSVINPSNMNLDSTFGNVYQIETQGSGFGTIKYYVEHNTDGEFSLVHIEKYANSNLLPSLQLNTLPLHLHNENIANTSEVKLDISSMSAFLEGTETITGPTNSTANGKVSVTTQTNILTLRNKSTYGGKTNHVNVVLKSLAYAGDGNASAIFKLVEDASLGGSPSYTDINTTNSVIEVDTAGTTVTGGKVLGTFIVAKNAGSDTDLFTQKIILGPGKALTISAESTASNSPDVAVTWVEDF